MSGDGFPVDDASLLMLAEACRINPDNAQTNLGAFLDMGARIKSSTLLSDPDDDGPPIYEVEYDDGYAPFSPQGVILALVEEIQRLKSVPSGGAA